MTDPLNYTSAFDNLPSPLQAFTQGYGSGAAIRDDQLKQQQQQVAQQQAQQMRVDLQSLMANPTPKAIGEMSIKYPQLSESLKRSADMLSPEQRQAQITQALPIYAAALNGAPDVAGGLLRKQAEAMRNSGDEHGATAAETMATLINDHPEFAKANGGMWLANLMGPEKFISTFSGIGGEQRAQEQAPADLAKKQADASKAGAEATVANATIPTQIQKPAEEILSAQAKRRVDDLNVQIAQADSETKRGQLTLERDKFIAEQQKTQQTAGTDSQNQMDTIGQSIATVKSLMEDPLLTSAVGVGTTTGKLLGYVPGTDNKDFRAKVDTLKSQQFLTQAKEMKGMGALSDAEGARIERAVASLDTDQSPQAFKNALGVIKSTLEKGQAKIVASGKLPSTGGAYIMKHPVYGNVKEGDINRLLTQFPGSTRDQVLQYLQSTGGK